MHEASSWMDTVNMYESTKDMPKGRNGKQRHHIAGKREHYSLRQQFALWIFESMWICRGKTQETINQKSACAATISGVSLFANSTEKFSLLNNNMTKMKFE